MTIVQRAVFAAAVLLSGVAMAADGVQIKELAPLPKPVTSFGAAVADGWLYVYGGHLGTPHEYSADLQGRDLLRLNLAKPDKWEVVAEGPRRTGLAMVAYAGKLYRIGGWEAKNAAGEKWELHSSRDFARFDPKSGQWQDARRRCRRVARATTPRSSAASCMSSAAGS